MICLNGCKKKLKLLHDVKDAYRLEIARLKMDSATYLRVIDEHSNTINDLTCKYKSDREKLIQEIENLKKQVKRKDKPNE